MSEEILFKFIVAFVLGGCVTWGVFSREGDELGYTGRQRYLPYVKGYLLPLYFLFLFPTVSAFFCMRLMSAEELWRGLLSLFFDSFLYISLYYLIFLPLLPLLRRKISARACAMLWMLPNYLYCMENGTMRLGKPLFVIRTPGGFMRILFGIWLVGFFCVLIAGTVSHLIFRRRVLKDAQPVTAPEVLAVWNAEVERAKFKNPQFQLVFSPAVSTPLSIGLFRRKVRVVLPARDFAVEDFSLIFRHEIVHIGREDAWSKFFLVFCTAICWFNPLVWIAMRKSAEDLELSCDETVLIGSDEEVKRRYADLLLRTAGDERGYSTCLSASASALRYRLKNIMVPPQKSSGAFLMGLLVFALIMGFGCAALSYDGGTGAQLIYVSGDPFSNELLSVCLLEKTEESRDSYRERWVLMDGKPQDENQQSEGAVDTHGILAYLASLELTHLTGKYSFDGSERQCFLYFGKSQDVFSIRLYDHYLVMLAPRDGRLSEFTYYLPQGVDWEYFDTLLRTS